LCSALKMAEEDESIGDSHPTSVWLKEGWFRNHFDGTLNRTEGEFHRGPERAGGWSERNLALMLLDYVNIEPSRGSKLHKAKTRPDLLKLAEEWDVPYMSQLEWERTIDTDHDWFEVVPVSRSFITPYTTKNIYILANIQDIPYLSGNYKQPGKFHSSILSGENKFIEGRWDWEVPVSEHLELFGDVINNSPHSNTVLKIRPRISPPGVNMYYCETTDSENENGMVCVIGLEVLSSLRLIEVRQLVKIIEGMWNLRRHDFQLILEPNNNVAAHKSTKKISTDLTKYAHGGGDGVAYGVADTTVALSPLDRFVDLCDDTAAIHLKLTPKSWAESDHRELPECDSHSLDVGAPIACDMVLYLLQFQFDVRTEYEKRHVRSLSWVERVEGASSQVVAAAEVENVFNFLNQDEKHTYEYMYALIDERSGNILNSFTEVKSPPVASANTGSSLIEPDQKKEHDGDSLALIAQGSSSTLLPYHEVRDILIYSR
jgi:hypothetical protein